MVDKNIPIPDQLPPHITHDDPLLASLVQVIKHYDIEISAQQLTVGLPLQDERLTLSLAQRAAERARCQTTIIRRKLKGIPDKVLPAILLLKGGHYCVLWRDDGDTLTVSYPENPSPVTIERQQLEQSYDGLALFVRPQYRVESRSIEGLEQDARKNWFWASIFGHWRLLSMARSEERRVGKECRCRWYRTR